MVQFSRPESTLVYEWASSTAHLNIDEPASSPDGAYVSAGPTSYGDTLEVKLNTIVDPRTSTGHILRTRTYANSGSYITVGLTVYLMQGTTVIGSQSYNSTGTQDHVWTLSAGQANSITDYSDLRVKVIPYDAGGGTLYATGDLHYVEFEVPDAVAGSHTAGMDIFEHIEPFVVVSSGTHVPTSSEIKALTDGNILTSAVTVPSGKSTTLDFDFQLTTSGTILSKTVLHGSFSSAETNLKVYLTEDFETYELLPTPANSFESGSSKAEFVTSITNNQSQDFCPFNSLHYRVLYNESVVRKYEASTNTWSTNSLGFTTGQGLVIQASTLEPKLWVIPGNGTSNFYEIDVSGSYTITPKTPCPAVTDNSLNCVNRAAFDERRNRVYFGFSLNHNRLWMYDVANETWHSLSTPVYAGFCMAYADNVDRLCWITAGGSYYTMNPYDFTWTSMGTVWTQDSLHNKPNMRYHHGLEYLIADYSGGGTNNSRKIGFIDPAQEKFTGLYNFVNDSVLNESTASTATGRVLSIDEDRGEVLTSTRNDTNIVNILDSDLLRGYHNSTISDAVKYKGMRLEITGPFTLSQVKAYAVSDNIALITNEESEYAKGSWGDTGAAETYQVQNTNSQDALSATAFILADGSEGSRYMQLSDDQITWTSNCYYNDLDNGECTVGNSNYNTSGCQTSCPAYAPDWVSLGAVTASGSKNVYARSKFPVSMERKLQQFSIGVEMVFDDN